jgi:hypothetical protein
VRDILQPTLSVGWSRSARNGIVLDGIRVGAGLAVGAPLGKRKIPWLGLSLVPHALWTRAADRTARSAWAASLEPAVLLQVRPPPGVVVGFRLGVEVISPQIRVIGENAALRWGAVRLLAGLEIGLRLPPRP